MDSAGSLDLFNRVLFQPTEVHLAASKYLLVLTAFVHFSYIGCVLGTTLFSVFFNIVDRDTPSHDARTLSEYLAGLAASNKGLMVYLGVLPVVTAAVLYAQVLYATHQLTTAGFAAGAAIVPVAFILLSLYRSSFRLRQTNYPLHIVLGAAALGAFFTAYFIICSGVSLSLDPEKWPFITNPAEFVIFSWNNIARFVLFLGVSFAITGTAVLFLYFAPEAAREKEESYNRLVRNFALGLAMGSCLLLPVLIFWNLITVPDVGKSIPMYQVTLLSVVALAAAGRWVYGLLVDPEARPGFRPLGAVLVFFFLLTVADAMTRENAFRDHNYMLLAQAQAARLEEESKRRAAVAEKAGEAVGEGDPVQGERLSQLNGCLSCHSVDGSANIGPTWKGLYGHEVVVLEGGKEVTVVADDAYIVQSIRDPNSQVVKGFQAIMPAQPTMSDQDIAHIIAYIKTLK